MGTNIQSELSGFESMRYMGIVTFIYKLTLYFLFRLLTMTFQLNPCNSSYDLLVFNTHTAVMIIINEAFIGNYMVTRPQKTLNHFLIFTLL